MDLIAATNHKGIIGSSLINVTGGNTDLLFSYLLI